MIFFNNQKQGDINGQLNIIYHRRSDIHFLQRYKNSKAHTKGADRTAW